MSIKAHSVESDIQKAPSCYLSIFRGPSIVLVMKMLITYDGSPISLRKFQMKSYFTFNYYVAIHKVQTTTRMINGRLKDVATFYDSTRIH